MSFFRVALLSQGTLLQVLNRIRPHNFVESFHSSSVDNIKWENGKPRTPGQFLKYNEKVYPPQQPDEPPRPAFVCHVLPNIKYSQKRLWYIAEMVRGKTVDEAVKQLNFLERKGALYVKKAILEAQQLAVDEHNVEFKTNLWIAESFVGKGFVLKGIRRHARKRIGIVEYKYVHYFVRLEEGTPPAHYYPPHPEPLELLHNYVDSLRARKPAYTL